MCCCRNAQDENVSIDMNFSIRNGKFLKTLAYPFLDLFRHFIFLGSLRWLDVTKMVRISLEAP